MCDCEKIKNTDEYVIAWKCWYNDGTENIQEYNSMEHCLEKLPDDGFQAMKLFYSDGGSRIMNGHDFYFFCTHPSGLIFGATNNENDISRYENAFVKRGKHIPDGMMNQINLLMYGS